MAYPTLLALGALDAAGYSLIAPVVPELAEATGASPALIGGLVAIFAVGMVLGFAAAGEAIKRYGARPVLTAALALIALGCLGFALGDGLAAYFVSRFAMGVGSGGLWIAITFSTLELWPGQEYICMSRIFAAYSIGGLIGPVLGAIRGIDGPFLAYAVLVVASLVPVALMRPPARRRAFTADRTALRRPGFWVASAAILFTVLALGVVEGVLPLHFARRLDQTPIGLIYAAVSGLVAISAALAARFRPRNNVVVAALLITAGLALAGAAGRVPLWIAALALAGTGIGLGNTGAIGMLLEAVRPERIVTAMIIWSQIGIAGYLFGPVAAGAVAETLGFAALGLVPLAASLVLLGMLRWAPTPRRATPVRAARGPT
jgi:MFS family permease